MVREFQYRGKNLEELQKLELKELLELFPARAKRSLKRGFTHHQKKLLEKVKLANQGKYKKVIKTHARDMIVLPEMVGLKIGVHNGKAFNTVQIITEMVGHRLGEFSFTRKMDVRHSGPGVGATRGSKHQSVK